MLVGVFNQTTAAHCHSRTGTSGRLYYNWVVSMQIEKIAPSRTAMIVVDMQNDFVAPGAVIETPAARAMVPKLVEALRICRQAGIRVVYTAHVHRRDGSDMGLFDDIHPPIASRAALVDGTPGVEIYPDLAPQPGEHIIKKHRYSGLVPTSIFCCANGALIRSSSPARQLRTAVTPRPVTRCSVTTGPYLCQMSRQLMTIRTAASGRCPMRRYIMPRW